MEPNLKGYILTLNENFSIFVKNFVDTYLANFNILIHSLQSIWQRLGKEKDLSGNSHLGLLYFANCLIRHSIFGFQHLATYQSFFCWLTFRPGLEALLILGKFVDDPHNADIWRTRESAKEAYIKTFQREIISKSLPRSAQFREVLSRLNDQFMHPNPEFVYRDTSIVDEGGSFLFLRTEYFDSIDKTDIYESHLLAYLNLLDQICWSSDGLVRNLYGPSPKDLRPQRSFAESSEKTAIHLASSNPLCKKIMEELGLWAF